MPLNNYQKYILKDIRNEERIYGLNFISLGTGSGYFSSHDAYRRVTYTEMTTLFSGAVFTNPYVNKNDSEGGFYNTSTLVIIASRDHISIAAQKDTKIEYAGKKYRINKVIDCEDSSELVLYVSQLE